MLTLGLAVRLRRAAVPYGCAGQSPRKTSPLGNLSSPERSATQRVLITKHTTPLIEVDGTTDESFIRDRLVVGSGDVCRGRSVRRRRLSRRGTGQPGGQRRVRHRLRNDRQSRKLQTGYREIAKGFAQGAEPFTPSCPSRRVTIFADARSAK